MTETQAWIFILLFWAAPVLHVVISKRSGGWRPPEGSRCPLGPRAGWFVMTLCLGLIGWLMFARWAYGRRGGKPVRRDAPAPADAPGGVSS